MTSTGGGAGRRTDRFSDGIKPLQLRERPLAAVPLLPLYRKTRAGVDYFIGGGAGPAYMKDLVVADWTSDVESTAPLDFLWQHDLWTPFGCPMSCKIRSIISVVCDSTTKSDGICDFSALCKEIA